MDTQKLILSSVTRSILNCSVYVLLVFIVLFPYMLQLPIYVRVTYPDTPSAIFYFIFSSIILLYIISVSLTVSFLFKNIKTYVCEKYMLIEFHGYSRKKRSLRIAYSSINKFTVMLESGYLFSKRYTLSFTYKSSEYVVIGKGLTKDEVNRCVPLILSLIGEDKYSYYEDIGTPA